MVRCLDLLDFFDLSLVRPQGPFWGFFFKQFIDISAVGASLGGKAAELWQIIGSNFSSHLFGATSGSKTVYSSKAFFGRRVIAMR